jgi:hypothetical protein
MRETLTFQEKSSYVLPPWTSYSNHVLRVDDPHRGHQSFSVDARISKPVDVTLCASMNACRLPESLVKTLVIRGYAWCGRTGRGSCCPASGVSLDVADWRVVAGAHGR